MPFIMQISRMDGVDDVEWEEDTTTVVQMEWQFVFVSFQPRTKSNPVQCGRQERVQIVISHLPTLKRGGK